MAAKDNKQRETSEPKISEPIKRCKSRCIATTAVLLSATLVVGGYFFYRLSQGFIKQSVDQIVHAYLNTEGATRSEVARLKDEISRLNKQIESLPAYEKSKSPTCDELRQRWKAWMALRLKMQAEEPFEEELKKFEELFACDEELLAMVRELANGVEVISNEDSDKIVGVCKNALKKIVKFKRINKRKLAEISGYVLSSCSCGSRE